MKNKSIVSIVCALLGFAALADYDYHSFTSGTPIPLFDSSTSAALSYVEMKQNAKRDGTVYEMAQSANGAAPIIVVYLNNETAGDYLFYFKGSSKNAAATYTATIADVDDTTYSKTLTGAQAKTQNWGIDAYGTDHTLLVKSLPAGKFTLTFTVACSNGWMGHYGNFTFTKIGGTLDIANNLNADIDLGTPFTDSSDKFGSQTTEGWVSLVRASSDTGHGSLLLQDNGLYLDSTKHGDTVTFYLYNSTKATYRLSYKAGTASANTGVSIAWTLTDAATEAEVYSGSNDVTPNDSNAWTLSNEYTDSFGVLPAGYYILKAKVQRSSNTGGWACNFGYFSLSQSFTLDLDGTSGTTIELDEDSLDREVVISNNPTVDLMGHDLTLNVASTTFSGALAVTNSDTEDTSVLTLKGAVTTAWLQSITVTGNVKLVVDGITSDIDFEKTNASAISSTHTGGTTFQNFGTRKVSMYKSANIGSGTLALQDGGYLSIPSGNAQNGSANPWTNDIAISGDGNRMDLQGSQYGDLYFTGNWSGDGSVWIHNGWQPTIYFANASGNNDAFTGTLSLTYRGGGSNKGFVVSGASNGFKNGTVVLTNDYNNTEAKITRVLLQPAGCAAYFGRLITDGTGAANHTGTVVLNNSSSTMALYIGSTGTATDSDLFEGSFTDSGKGAMTLHKEGAGTLTLAGSTASTISGGIEVDGGTLYLDTTFTAATAVNVNEGGSFYGTIPANVTVTWNAGSVVDCDTAHTITGDVDLSNAVVTGNNPVDGRVFLTVTGTATGKPSVSAALAAVERYDGKRGKWGVRATTENGVTTYSLVWKPTGLIIIVR